MIEVYYFSGSGHSFAVAKDISQQLRCEIAEIGGKNERISTGETTIVVFPVYCQNIPNPVKVFLQKTTSKYIVLIATYGKISYGNVLYEAQKLVRGEVIAGACIPIGHTFLNGDYFFDAAVLPPIAERIKSPQRAHIPKNRKNPLSNIFPAFRSRIGVKIIKNKRCSNCGICEKNCPAEAIKNGRINSKCIRCLRCVTNCPQHALQYENRRILEKYLQSNYKEEVVLYL
ncbi:MAG: 4Fe-4S binding protein [Clostridiales bacterium]|nr:4Fe-4S binding protein [Clostridiales bacterium]